MKMELVGKGRPDAFTVDPGAPLHREQVPGEPPLFDRLAHLRIARVQPVAGPVEGKAIDHVRAAEPAQPILGFEQRATLAQLARAGQAGKAAADHDGSPTPAHISTPAVPRKPLAFRWLAPIAMLA